MAFSKQKWLILFLILVSNWTEWFQHFKRVANYDFVAQLKVSTYQWSWKWPPLSVCSIVSWGLQHFLKQKLFSFLTKLHCFCALVFTFGWSRFDSSQEKCCQTIYIFVFWSCRRRPMCWSKIKLYIRTMYLAFKSALKVKIFTCYKTAIKLAIAHFGISKNPARTDDSTKNPYVIIKIGYLLFSFLFLLLQLSLRLVSLSLSFSIFLQLKQEANQSLLIRINTG